MSPLSPPVEKQNAGSSKLRAARLFAIGLSLAVSLATAFAEPDSDEVSGSSESLADVPDGHLLRVRNLTRELFRSEMGSRSVESVAEQTRDEERTRDRERGALARVVYGNEAVVSEPAPHTDDGKTFTDEPSYLFQAREWHLDGFFVLAEDYHTSGAGGGVALSYYPLRWLGFGAEALAFSDLTQDGSASLLAYLRLPIDRIALSLHLVGGVGTSFDSGDFTAQFQLGAGFELRLLYEWGLLFDFRVVDTPGENPSYTARCGFRFLF